MVKIFTLLTVYPKITTTTIYIDQSDSYDLELHEAAFMYTDNRVDLTMGRQIIRWGKTDQFSPVGTINPRDLKEFMIPDYEKTKRKTSR